MGGLGSDCEMDPESGGGDKQRQKSGDQPIPLNLSSRTTLL